MKKNEEMRMQGEKGTVIGEKSMKNTVVSMNGFHAFLDKQKAFHEIWRVLKPGGDFIACFYIRGKGGFLYRFRRRKS
ncbi:class I SAM-dependent methyltransferase [Blautia luti]|nr:methyltransferase domain-containing protein [Blautia luti]